MEAHPALAAVLTIAALTTAGCADPSSPGDAQRVASADTVVPKRAYSDTIVVTPRLTCAADGCDLALDVSEKTFATYIGADYDGKAGEIACALLDSQSAGVDAAGGCTREDDVIHAHFELTHEQVRRHGGSGLRLELYDRTKKSTLFYFDLSLEVRFEPSAATEWEWLFRRVSHDGKSGFAVVMWKPYLRETMHVDAIDLGAGFVTLPRLAREELPEIYTRFRGEARFLSDEQVESVYTGGREVKLGVSVDGARSVVAGTFGFMPFFPYVDDGRVHFGCSEMGRQDLFVFCDARVD